jgi:hypothetical protein
LASNILTDRIDCVVSPEWHRAIARLCRRDLALSLAHFADGHGHPNPGRTSIWFSSRWGRVRCRADRSSPHGPSPVRRCCRSRRARPPDFPVHSEFTSGEDTIASFLYLSEGWTPARGGRLRLHAANDASAVGAAIEPIRNWFIAFQTKAEHWHSVERVHGWERLSILALWNIEAE